MNKYIKKKKTDKLRRKRNFEKEDLLFLRQFPRLFPTFYCIMPSISRIHIKKVYNRVMKYKIMNRDEFETSIKTILFNFYNGTPITCFNSNSYFRYYYDLYTQLGIIFKDNEGNIKLRLM